MLAKVKGNYICITKGRAEPIETGEQFSIQLILLPTLFGKKKRGRNWVPRPICMSMLVTGFWIAGRMSPGRKFCSFLWWRSLHRTSASSWLPAPHSQVQIDSTNVEVASGTLLNCKETVGWGTYSSVWRLRACKGWGKWICGWSKVRDCPAMKSSGAAEITF